MASLRADHVNYLIWRYLQESGFGHTAVQMGREWHSNPQDLPFAEAVKPSELISILQDGLAYDEITAQVKTTDKRYAFVDAKARAPSQPVAVVDDGQDEVDEAATARSRKRPKLDRGGTDDRRKRASNVKPTTSEDAMEVDGTEAPAEVKVEEPPIVTTAEIGEEKGVQSKTPYEPIIAEPIAVMQLHESDVMNLDWARIDGQEGLLASGGGLCRWYSHLLEHHEGEPNLKPRFKDLTSVPQPGTISCTAKDKRTGRLAWGSDDATNFTIKIRTALPDQDTNDAQLKSITSGKGTVVLLRWSKSAKSLMYAAQYETGDVEPSILSHLAVLEATATAPLLAHTTETPIEDAAWTSEDGILICGENLLEFLRITAEDVESASSIETDTPWSMLKYDEVIGRACCISPEDGNIALVSIDDSKISFHSKSSHGGQLTAIEWQPTAEAKMMDSTRFLATSSIDGTIKLWNAHHELECTRTMTMETSAPAMALAFSNNGTYVAVAGDGRVCIWLVDEGPEAANDSDQKDKPVAIWHYQSPHSDDQTPGSPVEDAPFHVLAWNESDELLAYSWGDKVSHPVVDIANTISLT